MSDDKKQAMESLGIKSLEDILAEDDTAFDDEEYELPMTIEERESEDNGDSPGSLMKRAEMTNDKHSRDMKRIFDSAMETAERMADMGMNIDPMKAPRMFEVMGQHLKIAADASNSERDAQLKLMKLMQDQEKLELDKIKLKHEMGDAGEVKGEVVMVEDRNKILAQLKSQK